MFSKIFERESERWRSKKEKARDGEQEGKSEKWGVRKKKRKMRAVRENV